MSTYKIGICVRYGNDLYTLAFVIFKPNGDVILSQHYGDYARLDNGTKFNPHITYHVDGTYHVAAYNGYPKTEKRQPLGPGFTGSEHLIDQGFGKDHAKRLGQDCIGYDYLLEVDSAKLHDNLARFSIALLAPGTSDSSVIRVGPAEIGRVLIKDTFPWCLITVQNYA